MDIEERIKFNKDLDEKRRGIAIDAALTFVMNKIGRDSKWLAMKKELIDKVGKSYY